MTAHYVHLQGSQNGSKIQPLQTTGRQGDIMSQSCQDVEVDAACQDVKPVEVVSRFRLVEFDVEPVEVNKHSNC